MTSYEGAGVDLEAADEVVSRIGPRVTRTWNDRVVGGFGGFAAGIQIPDGYRNPVLMMSTDGIGTKGEIARQTGLFHGLGFDLVAMVADDLVAVGARTIALTDYIAVGRINVDVIETIIRSVSAACVESEISLLGGETAEHPGVMDPEQFDLSGTALGILEMGTQIDTSSVTDGDVMVGVRSPNLRSNGFSLVRAIIEDRLPLDAPFPGTDVATAKTLLEPSIVYSAAILDLLTEIRPHGLAHITGGGLPGNLRRVLPHDTKAEIETSRWERPHVFTVLQDVGGVETPEMFRTFNMGVGFVVIVPPGDVDATIRSLAANKLESSVIGRIVKGDGTVALLW